MEAGYGIKSASRSGSITPFWSFALSKPSDFSARIVAVTIPAMSARLAMAFHAVKSWLQSALNVSSTCVCNGGVAAGCGSGVGVDGVPPGVGWAVSVVSGCAPADVGAGSQVSRGVQHGDVIWSYVRPNCRSYAVVGQPAPNPIAPTGFAA